MKKRSVIVKLNNYDAPFHLTTYVEGGFKSNFEEESERLKGPTDVSDYFKQPNAFLYVPILTPLSKTHMDVAFSDVGKLKKMRFDALHNPVLEALALGYVPSEYFESQFLEHPSLFDDAYVVDRVGFEPDDAIVYKLYDAKKAIFDIRHNTSLNPRPGNDIQGYKDYENVDIQKVSTFDHGIMRRVVQYVHPEFSSDKATHLSLDMYKLRKSNLVPFYVSFNKSANDAEDMRAIYVDFMKNDNDLVERVYDTKKSMIDSKSDVSSASDDWVVTNVDISRTCGHQETARVDTHVELSFPESKTIIKERNVDSLTSTVYGVVESSGKKTDAPIVHLKYMHKNTSVSHGNACDDFGLFTVDQHDPNVEKKGFDDANRLSERYESTTMSTFSMDYILKTFWKHVDRVVEYAFRCATAENNVDFFWSDENRADRAWYRFGFGADVVDAASTIAYDVGYAKHFEKKSTVDGLLYYSGSARRLFEFQAHRRVGNSQDVSRAWTELASLQSTAYDEARFLFVMDCLFEDVPVFSQKENDERTSSDVPITFRTLKNTIAAFDAKRTSDKNCEKSWFDLKRRHVDAIFDEKTTDWFSHCAVKRVLFDPIRVINKKTEKNVKSVDFDDVSEASASRVKEDIERVARFKTQFKTIHDQTNSTNDSYINIVSTYAVYATIDAVVSQILVPGFIVQRYSTRERYEATPTSLASVFKMWALEYVLKYYAKDPVLSGVFLALVRSATTVWDDFEKKSRDLTSDFAKCLNAVDALFFDLIREERTSTAIFDAFLSDFEIKNSHYAVVCGHDKTFDSKLRFGRRSDSFSSPSRESSLLKDRGKRFDGNCVRETIDVINAYATDMTRPKDDDAMSTWHGVTPNGLETAWFYYGCRWFPTIADYHSEADKTSYFRIAFCRLKKIYDALDGIKQRTHKRADVHRVYGPLGRLFDNGSTVVTQCRENEWDLVDAKSKFAEDDPETKSKLDGKLLNAMDRLVYFGDGDTYSTKPLLFYENRNDLYEKSTKWIPYGVVTQDYINERDAYAPYFEPPGQTERLDCKTFYYFSDKNRIAVRQGLDYFDVAPHLFGANDDLRELERLLLDALVVKNKNKFVYPIPCAKYSVEGQCFSEIKDRYDAIKSLSTALHAYAAKTPVATFSTRFVEILKRIAKNTVPYYFETSNASGDLYKIVSNQIVDMKCALKSILDDFDRSDFYESSSRYASETWVDDDDRKRDFKDEVRSRNWSEKKNRTSFYDRYLSRTEYRFEWHVGKTYCGDHTYVCDYDYNFAYDDVVSLAAKKSSVYASKSKRFETMNYFDVRGETNGRSLTLTLFVVKKYPKYGLDSASNETQLFLFGEAFKTGNLTGKQNALKNYVENANEPSFRGTIFGDYVKVRKNYVDNVVYAKTKSIKGDENKKYLLSPIDFENTNYFTPFSNVSNPFNTPLTFDADDDATATKKIDGGSSSSSSKDDERLAFEERYARRLACKDRKMGTSTASDLVAIYQICTHNIFAVLNGELTEDVRISNGNAEIDVDFSDGYRLFDSNSFFQRTLVNVSLRFLFEDPIRNAHWLSVDAFIKNSIVVKKSEEKQRQRQQRKTTSLFGKEKKDAALRSTFTLKGNVENFETQHSRLLTFLLLQRRRSSAAETAFEGGRSTLLSDTKMDFSNRYLDFYRSSKTSPSTLSSEVFDSDNSDISYVVVYDRNDIFNSKRRFFDRLETKTKEIQPKPSAADRFLTLSTNRDDAYDESSHRVVSQVHHEVLNVSFDEYWYDKDGFSLPNIEIGHANVDTDAKYYVYGIKTIREANKDDYDAVYANAYIPKDVEYEPNLSSIADELADPVDVFVALLKTLYDEGSAMGDDVDVRRFPLSTGSSADAVSNNPGSDCSNLFYAETELDRSDDILKDRRNDHRTRDLLQKFKNSYATRHFSDFLRRSRFGKSRFVFENDYEETLGRVTARAETAFRSDFFVYVKYNFKRAMEDVVSGRFVFDKTKTIITQNVLDDYKRTRTSYLNDRLKRYRAIFDHDVGETIEFVSEPVSELLFDMLFDSDSFRDKDVRVVSSNKETTTLRAGRNGTNTIKTDTKKRVSDDRCKRALSHATYLDVVTRIVKTTLRTLTDVSNRVKTKINAYDAASQLLDACLSMSSSSSSSSSLGVDATFFGDSFLKNKDVALKCIYFIYDFWVGRRRRRRSRPSYHRPEGDDDDDGPEITVPGIEKTMPKIFGTRGDDIEWIKTIFDDDNLCKQPFSKREDDFEVVHHVDLLIGAFSSLSDKIRTFSEIVKEIRSVFGSAMVDHLTSRARDDGSRAIVKNLCYRVFNDRSKNVCSDYNALVESIFDGKTVPYAGTPMYIDEKDAFSYLSVDKSFYVDKLLSGLSLHSFFKLFEDAMTVRAVRDYGKTLLLSPSDTAYDAYRAYVEKISEALKNATSDRRSAWMNRLTAFGNDRLASWFPDWSTTVEAVVATDDDVAVDVKRCFKTIRTSNASQSRAASMLFDRIFGSQCVFIDNDTTYEKIINASVSEGEIKVYERKSHSTVCKIRPDRPASSSSEIERDVVEEDRRASKKRRLSILFDALHFVSDAFMRGRTTLPKFLFLSLNHKIAERLTNDVSFAFRRRRFDNLSFVDNRSATVVLSNRVLEDWTSPVATFFTSNQAWFDGLAFHEMGDDRSGSEPLQKRKSFWVLNVKSIVNMLFLEHNVYPVLKEMVGFNLYHENEKERYLKSLFYALEMARRELIVNAKKNDDHRRRRHHHH